MKLTKRQLRKLIMEMPMGVYFGSMHGGSGDDLISAIEVEAMKYPDHSIYIDDASNNPNEFVISSSRRDDAMGPHSHYLSSVHVEVQERDGMIYIDGRPFSSFEQAAAQILIDLEDERQYSINEETMKLTRNQLRRLINEAMIKPGIPNVPSAEAQGKIDDLARAEEFQASADSMADVFGYPQDQSYSGDLMKYDQFGRQGPSIPVMRELGKKYANAEEHGEPEEYYIRRRALRKAAEICDSFDMSMVKLLIDAFTEGANDYEKESMAQIGRPPRFEYEAYNIAGEISLKSRKLDFHKGENYSNLYE